MGKSNFIYIGPNIPQIGLKQNTIYRGEKIPVKLQEIVDKKPVVAALFVPTARLAEAKQRMREKGSLEYGAAHEVATIAKRIPR